MQFIAKPWQNILLAALLYPWLHESPADDSCTNFQYVLLVFWRRPGWANRLHSFYHPGQEFAVSDWVVPCTKLAVKCQQGISPCSAAHTKSSLRVPVQRQSSTLHQVIGKLHSQCSLVAAVDGALWAEELQSPELARCSPRRSSAAFSRSHLQGTQGTLWVFNTYRQLNRTLEDQLLGSAAWSQISDRLLKLTDEALCNKITSHPLKL